MGITQRFFDLTNPDVTSRHLSDLRPQAIIHCAAMTNVDYCEKARAEAWKVNVEATKTVSHWAEAHSAQFVFISSDSVFDGGAGDYDENAAAHPLNEYARTKVAAEEIVRERMPRALIVRTNFYGQSWKKGKASLGEWMLGKLLRKECFNAFGDVRFNPLLTNALSKIIFELVARKACGNFHVGARDSCSKYEYARMLANIFNLDSNGITPVSVSASSLDARRPRNTTLCVSKVTGFLGREMPSVEDGLRSFYQMTDEGGIARLMNRRANSLAMTSVG